MTFEAFMKNHEERMKQLNDEVEKLNNVLSENEAFMNEHKEKMNKEMSEIESMLAQLNS